MNKEKLSEIAYNFSSNYNDKELLYIIKELKWWYKERKRQEKEIKGVK